MWNREKNPDFREPFGPWTVFPSDDNAIQRQLHPAGRTGNGRQTTTRPMLMSFEDNQHFCSVDPADGPALPLHRLRW